jgi:hypothetical protein
MVGDDVVVIAVTVNTGDDIIVNFAVKAGGDVVVVVTAAAVNAGDDFVVVSVMNKNYSFKIINTLLNSMTKAFLNFLYFNT